MKTRELDSRYGISSAVGGALLGGLNYVSAKASDVLARNTSGASGSASASEAASEFGLRDEPAVAAAAKS